MDGITNSSKAALTPELWETLVSTMAILVVVPTVSIKIHQVYLYLPQ